MTETGAALQRPGIMVACSAAGLLAALFAWQADRAEVVRETE